MGKHDLDMYACKRGDEYNVAIEWAVTLYKHSGWSMHTTDSLSGGRA